MAITLNKVTVSGQAVDLDGSPVAGQLLFEVNDLIWTTDPGTSLFSMGTAIGVTFGNGSPGWTVDLFATDNSGISNNWRWRFSGSINGIEFPSRLLLVPFAGGAQQTLTALLLNSVLEPK